MLQTIPWGMPVSVLSFLLKKIKGASWFFLCLPTSLDSPSYLLGGEGESIATGTF